MYYVCLQEKLQLYIRQLTAPLDIAVFSWKGQIFGNPRFLTRMYSSVDCEDKSPGSIMYYSVFDVKNECVYSDSRR